jgi:DNA-binding transcriptional ArsR family regulator
MTAQRTKHLTPRTPAASLERVLKALADPVRLSIVRQLLEGTFEMTCGGFECDVSKATMSHHLAMLEDVGIIQGRTEGTRRLMSLRVEELQRDYPGLLELIRSSP